MSGEEYKKLVSDTFNLINKEIDFWTSPEKQQFLVGSYFKFVLMYQFFRMLRGEAFVDVRPREASDYQKEYYAMENELRLRLETIKAKLDPSDPYTQIKIKDMQRNFEL